MKRAATMLGLAGVFILCGAPTCGGVEDLGHCASNTYVANLQGLEATAKVSVEVLPDYTLVAGEVVSATARYSFKAELLGDRTRGWGEMVNLQQIERFQIQVDVTPGGFVLTANPFGGGGATSYDFHCK